MKGAPGLQSRLLTAHEVGDSVTLSRLYTEAADLAEAEGDRDRAAFFLTHAWVFALDAGSGTADVLQNRLRSWGRC